MVKMVAAGIEHRIETAHHRAEQRGEHEACESGREQLAHEYRVGLIGNRDLIGVQLDRDDAREHHDERNEQLYGRGEVDASLPVGQAA